MQHKIISGLFRGFEQHQKEINDRSLVVFQYCSSLSICEHKKKNIGLSIFFDILRANPIAKTFSLKLYVQDVATRDFPGYEKNIYIFHDCFLVSLRFRLIFFHFIRKIACELRQQTADKRFQSRKHFSVGPNAFPCCVCNQINHLSKSECLQAHL